MHKIRLIAVFYRSTLTDSILFSLIVAALGAGLGFVKVFGLVFMTGGWILSLGYKELTRKNEYIFYNNLGITKSLLLVSCICLNLLIGFFCMVYGNF